MVRVVVIYDIVNNKERKKVSDILEGYGIRVNKSVFECELKNEKTKEKMIEEILNIVNPKRDSVRIYAICKNCLIKSESLCYEDEPFEAKTVHFV